MSGAATNWQAELQRIRNRSVIAGTVCLGICIIGAFFSPTQFFRAYLTVYLYCLGLSLGSFAILAIYFLTGGAWGFLIRRFLEAAMRTLPVLTVLITPLAVGVGYLYLWARPAVVAGSKELRYNHIYLNTPFWWGRMALYFASWLAIEFVLSAWSRQQDRTGNPYLPRKFRLLSAPAMVVYGVTITFASVDWVMSLQPTFHSTIFGPLFASGQLVSAQALAVLSLAWVAERTPFRSRMSAEALNDLGNLMLTFLIIWAYMEWFQFMLVWMANMPSEDIWYLPRVAGGWRWVIWSVFVLHFAVPFFALLMREVKQNPRSLGEVAALILGMHLVFMYWQVMPPFLGTGIADHWMDFLMPVGLGGIWFGAFIWQLQRFPLLPVHDFNAEEAMHLRHLDREAVEREEAVRHG